MKLEKNFANENILNNSFTKKWNEWNVPRCSVSRSTGQLDECQGKVQSVSVKVKKEGVNAKCPLKWRKRG